MRHGSDLRVLLMGFVALAPGCGGGGEETAAPRTAADVEERRAHHETSKMAASSEIGALDEGKVSQTFQSALDSLKRCLSAGAERNEFEGGDIAFLVKIDSSGKVVHAQTERSTIGDRETEKCMLSALRKRSWPRPQGG